MDEELVKGLKPMVTILYEIFKDPETAESVATMYWNLFEALKRKGFNEEQALKIIITFSLNTGGKK